MSKLGKFFLTPGGIVMLGLILLALSLLLGRLFGASYYFLMGLSIIFLLALILYLILYLFENRLIRRVRQKYLDDDKP